MVGTLTPKGYSLDKVVLGDDGKTKLNLRKTVISMEQILLSSSASPCHRQMAAYYLSKLEDTMLGYVEAKRAEKVRAVILILVVGLLLSFLTNLVL